MTNFTVEGFTNGCKKAMAGTDNRKLAAKQFLQQTRQENDSQRLSNS